MLPEFPKFKKLELSDREAIEQFATKFLPYSDFNFTALFCWDIYERRKISLLNGNLVVRFTDDLNGKEVYSFLGNNKIPETVQELLKLSKKESLSPKIKFIAKEIADMCILEKCPYVINEDRDNFDYIYKLQDFYALAGPSYASTRNSLNAFLKKNPGNYEVRLLNLSNESNKKIILEVLDKWTQQKEIYSKRETIAIHKLLKYADSMNLLNVLILYKDKPIAFSINQVLSGGHSISHFGKVDYNYFGVFPLLWKETSKKLLEAGCVYLNFEEDLGLSGLRSAKLKYRPAFFLKKYTIIK